jgi:hypothetical protein
MKELDLVFTPRLSDASERKFKLPAAEYKNDRIICQVATESVISIDPIEEETN